MPTFFTKSVSTTSEIVPGSQVLPKETSGGTQLLSITTTRARSREARSRSNYLGKAQQDGKITHSSLDRLLDLGQPHI